MTGTVRRGGTKRATNVSIRADLLGAARNAGLKLSATLAGALAEQLARDRRRKWLEANKSAIVAYNDSVKKSGVFSDGRRTF